jgi:hypothetical protein
MPKFEVRELEWIANTMQRLLLWVEPAGGQTVARRNAWAALVQDDQRRAQRLEAERASELVLRQRPREMAAV